MEEASAIGPPAATGGLRGEAPAGFPRCAHPSGVGHGHQRAQPDLHRRPKELSSQVVDTLHGAFKKALDDADFLKMSRQFDLPVVYRGPQELAKHIAQMNEEVEGLIKTLGLKTN